MSFTSALANMDRFGSHFFPPFISPPSSSLRVAWVFLAPLPGRNGDGRGARAAVVQSSFKLVVALVACGLVPFWSSTPAHSGCVRWPSGTLLSAVFHGWEPEEWGELRFGSSLNKPVWWPDLVIWQPSPSLSLVAAMVAEGEIGREMAPVSTDLVHPAVIKLAMVSFFVYPSSHRPVPLE